MIVLIYKYLKTKKMSESLTSTNIERTKRQLSNVEVQARLGGAATKLLALADSLYVPTLSIDGRIETQNDGVPIIALDAGSDLHLSGDNLGFSEEQRRAMHDRGISIREQEKMEDTLTNRTFTVPDFMGAAVVTKNGTYSTKVGDVRVRGRPVIVLNASNPRNHVANTILSHELVHVIQNQKKPFMRKSGYPNVHLEAEAYSLEGLVQAGLQSGHEPRATKANRVMQAYDEFRKSGRTLDEEAEQISFENQLRRAGIGVLGKNTYMPEDSHSH